ncbi:MAG: VOC family protein [Gammaproteobacteria bacterium]|nr:VOC family protein [Gammaproteobacteria bacterium]
MKISKLLYVAILVNDLVRAREFYEGVLGLKEKTRHSFDFDGVWYDLGENELHLMVVADTLPPAEQRPRRDFHVAFLVDDFEATKVHLAKLGIPYREGRHGLAQLFVRDPDGNLIELQQKA